MCGHVCEHVTTAFASCLCVLAMRAEYKIQAALAVLGIPLIFFIWKPDAKWPNPFSLRPPAQKE